MSYPLFIIPLVAMHFILFYGSFLIVVLSTNIHTLLVMGLILLALLALNHIFGDCPITIIEEHYTNTSLMDFINSRYPINYKKKNRPEVTLQWIFVVLMIAVTKIIYLLSKKFIKNNICT